MKRTRKKTNAPAADAIARMAENGKDVSRFFTNSGQMMKPMQRVGKKKAGSSGPRAAGRQTPSSE